jgi:hypothetical protein
MPTDELEWVRQVGSRGQYQLGNDYFLIQMTLDKGQNPDEVRVWRANEDGRAKSKGTWFAYKWVEGSSVEQEIRNRLARA